MKKLLNVIFLCYFFLTSETCVCLHFMQKSFFLFGFHFLVEAGAPEKKKCNRIIMVCQKLPPYFTVCTEIENIYVLVSYIAHLHFLRKM